MFQIIPDFLSGHLHLKKLVLERIDGKEIVINERAGLHESVECKRGSERDLSVSAGERKRMDKIQIVGHSPVCIPCAEVCLKDSDLLERECLDSLELRAEERLHLLVNLILVKSDQVCRKSLFHNLSTLDLDCHSAISEVVAVASGIDEADVLALMGYRAVVM